MTHTPPDQDLGRRLRGRRGADYWRSLEELAGSPELEELLAREFPQHAAEWPEGVDRRRFLQLASASLALGGLASCTRQPIEKIVPYVRQPEEIVPGRPLFFATSMTLGGYAEPLLAESHMGRPTKVEGNPDHPAGTGASDLFAQGSVLDLYDPERAQVVKELGRIRTWAAFVAETRAALKTLEALGPARLRILTGAVSSPTLAATIGRVIERFPACRWHQWEPLHRDAVLEGSRMAFGEAVETRYHLEKAEVVVTLDSDLLTSGPGRLLHARDFAAGRRPRRDRLEMNRLYAAESSPTTTATLADHRLPLKPSEIGAAAQAIAAELGLPGSPAPRAFAEGARHDWVVAAARDLAANRGRGVVVAGDAAPAAAHALAHAINARLDNVGATVTYADPVAAAPVTHGESLAELVTDMDSGEVDAILILGGNPVLDAPADSGFAEALLKVGRRIRLGLYEDETAEYCQWTLPEAHYLESWADGRAADGTVTLAQPIIEPLHGGRTATEVLAALVDDAPRPGDELLREQHRQAAGGEAFDRFWRRCLHDGFIAGSAAAARRPQLAADVAARARRALAGPATEGVEIAFRADPTLYDGRFANNAWLQECPKPLTKLTWDNAALMSPALAARLGVETERLVEIRAAERSIEAPVWIQPGMPDGMVTLHLGSGRPQVGPVGAGAGFDAYPLRTAAGAWALEGAEIVPLDGTRPLAGTQMHNNIELETREAEKRHLVRHGTLTEYAEHPEFVEEMAHGEGPSLFPPVEYPGHAWGLAVDLSNCTGCNACVVACQAENNIPIVGKEQVMLGREMHWIRIDRYYQGDLDDPAVHHQPVMCMHCEQAPCEVVCPVAATVHSDEGLNDMIYNRCVGTRYCSNNCPYKVRRFNFFKYNDLATPLLKMQRNPDVTVRTRGVMEKCTYCVQRINGKRIEARAADRELEDGEIVTACQQACPSGAIVFGDINDPESQVSKWKAEPLNYGMLEELNTRPRTTYLAKLNNPNPELAPPHAGGADKGHG